MLRRRDKFDVLLLLLIIVAVGTITKVQITPANVTGNQTVDAQILDKDPIPTIPIGGNATILGDVDLQIDFSEGALLPPNGTLSISTAGVTDFDIQGTIPPGISVILTNSSATATIHPVTIESSDSGSGDGGDSGGDGDE